MIELIGVSKQLGDHLVLDNASLSVSAGEMVGVIGRSGAGKSTLVRCINLLERPERGIVKVNGQSLLNLSEAELRTVRFQIGMVFQQFNLLHSQTVYDNIALPLRIQKQSKQAIQERVLELLTLIELRHKAKAYPSQLSGGQKQRVAIARAMASHPKLLLCDEATSALDPETTISILNLLRKINQLYGVTILLITHDMDVVKRSCRRVVLMESGRLLEDMKLAEVFQYPESLSCKMLYQQLAPELPACLTSTLTVQPNQRPLLRLFFQGESALTPFISQTSRELLLDINILLANVDRFDTVTCGSMVIELSADAEHLNRFIERCRQAKLTVEVLGYVTTAMA